MSNDFSFTRCLMWMWGMFSGKYLLFLLVHSLRVFITPQYTCHILQWGRDQSDTGVNDIRVRVNDTCKCMRFRNTSLGDVQVCVSVRDPMRSIRGCAPLLADTWHVADHGRRQLRVSLSHQSCYSEGYTINWECFWCLVCKRRVPRKDSYGLIQV